jgi:hypothetical protein
MMTGSQAELFGAEAQSLVHGQGGEADIHTVDIGDEIGGEQQRQHAPADAAHGGGFWSHCGQCQKGSTRRNFL